jgi:hypothetical protein
VSKRKDYTEEKVTPTTTTFVGWRWEENRNGKKKKRQSWSGSAVDISWARAWDNIAGRIKRENRPAANIGRLVRSQINKNDQGPTQMTWLSDISFAVAKYVSHNNNNNK